MMEKNNLDNLFKDKFKDFSETPNERVWENIEASLNKRKKKRIVPIWWQLGGVAAALALLFYLVNPFSSADEDRIDAKTVETENNIPSQESESKTKENTGPDFFEKTNENGVAGSTSSENSPEHSEDNLIKNSNTIKVATTKDNNVKQNTVNPKEGIAFAEGKKETERTFKEDSANKEMTDPASTKSTAIAETSTKQNEDTIQNATPVIPSTESEDAVAVAEGEQKDEKISIFDAIEQQQKDEEAVAANTDKKWSMGPSVAPVFYSSVGEGSPIHSNFASNAKSGNLNLSYGLTVTYNISDKLSVRSGVHRVDYGYDTNDVVFTSSLTTSTNDLIDNINYAQTSRNLVVESKNNDAAATSDNAFVGGTAQPFEGRMVQQLGYIEIPMELNYALLDKKFGINLIGGVSSLFLVDNAVSLESEQLITEMGEANNANDVNFSTNIGVGFNYEISQKIQLNIEPIFKYQLNTFSETAGNFRPYSVGVYSGLSFRF